MRLNLHIDQVGDTIIEVLIAIAVISTILGGAFVVTNDSTLSTRDAQERIDALQLANGQIELVKSQPLSPSILGSYSSGFCYYKNSSGSYTAQQLMSPSTGSPANCSVTSQGAPANPGQQPAYGLKITYDGTSTYSINISWLNVAGTGSNQVQMFYRTN